MTKYNPTFSFCKTEIEAKNLLHLSIRTCLIICEKISLRILHRGRVQTIAKSFLLFGSGNKSQNTRKTGF